MAEVRLWRWEYTTEFGKRRKTRYLLTEVDALAALKDPVKVEGSLEVRGDAAADVDELLAVAAKILA
jgi:hypothetical protein